MLKSAIMHIIMVASCMAQQPVSPNGSSVATTGNPGNPESRIAWAKKNSNTSDVAKQLGNYYILEAVGNNSEGLLLRSGTRFITKKMFDFNELTQMGFKWIYVTNNQFVAFGQLITTNGPIPANFLSIPVDSSIEGRDVYAKLNNKFEGSIYQKVETSGINKDVLVITISTAEENLRKIFERKELSKTFYDRGFKAIVISNGSDINFYTNINAEGYGGVASINAEDLYSKFNIMNAKFKAKIDADVAAYKSKVEFIAIETIKSTIRYREALKVLNYELRTYGGDPKKPKTKNQLESIDSINKRILDLKINSDKKLMEEIHVNRELIDRVTRSKREVYWNHLNEFIVKFVGGENWDSYAGGFAEMHITTGSATKDDQIRKDLLARLADIKTKYEENYK